MTTRNSSRRSIPATWTSWPLKGVLGNLAITPLFEPMSEITELLRVKEDADYPALVDAIMLKWNEFLAL